MINLKVINEDNFLDAFQLKLADEQEKYVSNPIRSLAQAYVYRKQCQPFGIYDGDEMVGYVMVIYDYDISEYDIWHMMIDASRQGRGYGSEVLNMSSTIQVRVEDELKSKSYAPMTEAEMLAKLEKSREQGMFRDADLVVSDMRLKYGL